jgi:chromosome segregation ATPase
MAKLRVELIAAKELRTELERTRADAKQQHDELVITQKALDRAGAQAAQLRLELAETQTELDRSRLEIRELEQLRQKLTDAELALDEAKQSQSQTRKRVERVEAQLSAAQGAAFASERAAEQLRMAQERMREALAPVEDERDAD